MKQVNFSHAGGFPLEQETLERLQTAYRSELFEALKSHFSIQTGTNYTVVPATIDKKGWAIIHQYEKDQTNSDAPEKLAGILYPIKSGTLTGFLKTTRTETNLIYGTGESQTAYFDYEAEYCPQKLQDTVSVSENGQVQTIYYYDLRSFETITDIHTIDTLLAAIQTNIDAIEANIDVIEGDVNAINGYLDRALVDSSTPSTTNLTLNYQSNWENTYVGGKVYLENINTNTVDFSTAKTSPDSLLIIDNVSQVSKSNNLLDSLLKRITKLETQNTSIPIGMVAIWGKTDPIPAGWEEYIPLKGRMPVGQNILTPEEKSDAQDGDGGNGISYYKDYYGSIIYPFETLGNAGGRMGKKLLIEELPPHSHSYDRAVAVRGYDFQDRTPPFGGYESADTSTVGEGKSFPILNPYRVVQFIVYKGFSSDTTAPTKPTLTFSNIGNSTLSLNWTAASDEFGVTKYLIYKDGNFLTETPGNVRSYYVGSLTAGTPYNFYVIARDAAGNLSARSDNGDVTTTAIIPPTIPQNIQANSEGQDQILVKWDASTDDSGSVQYELYRKPAGGSYTAFIMNPNTYYTDTDLSANTTYYYKVQALDAELNASGFNGEAYATTDPSTGGGGGGGGCFDIESLVTMASGQSKKLKNIEIGDKLQGLSFSNEIDESDGDYMVWNGKLNEAAKAEVTVVGKKASLQPNYYEIKTGDTTIKATGQHPLLVSENGENVKWVCTKNVVLSMLLIDKTGKTKAIESIVFKEEPLEVILLDVEDVDNYVISGIVAHNNKQPIEP